MAPTIDCTRASVEHGARNELLSRAITQGDQANTPLLAALASFSGIAVIFIVYALIARYCIRPQNTNIVGMVMADGTIWGPGGRRGKYEEPLGPPPCITEVWIPFSNNVINVDKSSWNTIQPIAAAPTNSTSVDATVDDMFYHPIAVSHLNPTLVTGPTLLSVPRARSRPDLLSPALSTALGRIGFRRWGTNQARESSSPTPSDRINAIHSQDPEHNTQDVDVTFLIRMPVPSLAHKKIDEESHLEPLVLGVTRGQLPRADILQQN